MLIAELVRGMIVTLSLCLVVSTTGAASDNPRMPACVIQKEKSKQPQAAVCVGARNKPNLAIDTQTYRDLRNELAMESGRLPVQRLCGLEQQLSAVEVQAQRAHNAEESESTAALMLLLGGNWEEVKQVQLARSAYVRTYQLATSAGAPSLTALSALQRLVNLESEDGSASCALQLADAQEEFARRLHSNASQSIVLVAEALELKADLLRKYGRHAEANAIGEQASELRDKDTCSGICR
jgi:hypothetical protein